MIEYVESFTSTKNKTLLSVVEPTININLSRY